MIESLLAPRPPRLLVRRDPVADKVGEIYVPNEQAMGKSTSGTILKAYEGAPWELAPGARVVFGEHAGVAVALEGVKAEEQVLILTAGEVLGVIAPGLEDFRAPAP